MDDLLNNPWFVLALGMGTVFVGLFLLILISKLMSLVINGLSKKERANKPAPAAVAAPAPAAVAAPAPAPVQPSEPAPAPAAAPVVYPHEVDRYAFDAAVAAAIAAYTGRNIRGFRITRITRL